MIIILKPLSYWFLIFKNMKCFCYPIEKNPHQYKYNKKSKSINPNNTNLNPAKILLVPILPHPFPPILGHQVPNPHVPMTNQ